jgi:tricorn protease
MRSHKAACLVWLAVIFGFAPGSAQVDARMLRFPDVSETHITFVYAGDIWIVPKAGGTASRLSSPPGEEAFPRFSPDGRSIAFSGNYDGNTDVYVVPAMGGTPVRITHHPAPDRLVDWTPDGGSVLFASARASGVQRYSQLYRVATSGGLPDRLPMAYGEFGSLSPDGDQIAYTPKDRGFRTWKRYRGGMAPEVWLFDLESLESQNISNSEANDAQPMWHDRTVYFLSDRDANQRSNIWAYELGSRELRQVTEFADFDITFPSLGPDEIVFQAGGRLYLLDLDTEEYAQVSVDLVTDLAALRPRTESVSDLLQWASISPTGKRALVQARGEVYTVPAEHGMVRQLTHTSGAAERYPAWSPDGKLIAYWSDASGEYELVLRPADGSGQERTVTSFGPGYRYQPQWSPDSEKLAFIDHTQTIRILEVESGQLSEVDRALDMLHGQLQGYEVQWSKDSRWLTWGRSLETGNGAVFLYDTANGRHHQVTSGYYSDYGPTFDPDGKYLYYFSNRSLSPIYSDIDQTWVYPNTTNLVAVPLRSDVPTPLPPRSDEEEVDEAEEEEAAEADPDDEGGDSADDLIIALVGFESRGVVLPPTPGNYNTLRAVPGKILYLRYPRSGSSDDDPALVFYDLEEREESTILQPANSFEVSADGKKLLVNSRGQWAIVDVRPEQKMDKRLDTDALETMVTPREEWQQLFTDVWRTYRDVFYDPTMHGLDWDALGEQYGALLDDAVTRWDVNFIIGELIGEVNASHTYVGGGDIESPRRRQVGLLGIDWALANGAYRVAHIVRGAEWDIEARSPLAEPGVNVNEGDYILAVNGVPLDTGKDPYAAFEGLAGETVALTVNSGPAMEGSREVLVETLSSEGRLRNLEWIEANRRRVDEATGGRVGYIFVPNTAVPGQTELVRQFNSQMRRDGLIIDERFNAGGQLPDRFIEKMNREVVTRIFFRNGATATQPPVNHLGPKVMLINGWAGSGGDAFPFFFKGLEVGPIIGERTWGGLIGPASGHGLIDGGFYTAPPGRLFGPDGEWFAEGWGVEPDIPVVDDPSQLARGVDPQLEAAINEVMRLIELNPPSLPDAPPFERRVPDDGGGR